MKTKSVTICTVVVLLITCIGFVEITDAQSMILIPGGEFLMGGHHDLYSPNPAQPEQKKLLKLLFFTIK